ncbi:methyltransferase [Tengunoibacter tsumagoiensis]|uniref:O-methyltransferase C-terminal domain-containing protein n=1 Tax=Tengunoibacter tsumagoiensis TaxID=2014871 RepID=A0A402A9Y2_9CHLR|nr:methyltransferase [Tengunoibacter tsumagoiensis]GCE15950.1 hypothetical protein KTT_58090 [Tengunoibacter tsumagoiensis]
MEKDLHQYIVDAYNFSLHSTVMEIGGEHGSLLQTIVQSYPSVHGILVTRASDFGESTIEGFEEAIGHCQSISSDYLQYVPYLERSGVAIVQMLLRYWSDKDARKILHTLRAASQTGATLLVIEQFMTSSDSDQLPFQQQGVLTESVKQNYFLLLEEADFAVQRIIPTNSPLSIIVGKAV